MELVVIVVNFETPQLTRDCLESLEKERAIWPHFRVMLVENGSRDDSREILEQAIKARHWASWVTLISESTNLGFAGGNNAAIRRMLGCEDPSTWVLLLNSDTIVHPGALEKAVFRMKQCLEIGVLSCMVRNRDGSVQNVCRRFWRPDREMVKALGLPYRFPRLFGWADPEDMGWNRETTAREVEWIGGAFMLLRVEALRAVGLLDETFFFYGEDVELCLRMRRAGWRVFFDPSGTVTHFGGGSSDESKMAPQHRLELRWEARFCFLRRCYGPVSAAWVRGVYTVAVFLNLLSLTITGRRGEPGWRRILLDLQVLLGGGRGHV